MATANRVGSGSCSGLRRHPRWPLRSSASSQTAQKPDQGQRRTAPVTTSGRTSTACRGGRRPRPGRSWGSPTSSPRTSTRCSSPPTRLCAPRRTSSTSSTSWSRQTMKEGDGGHHDRHAAGRPGGTSQGETRDNPHDDAVPYAPPLLARTARRSSTRCSNGGRPNVVSRGNTTTAATSSTISLLAQILWRLL